MEQSDETTATTPPRFRPRLDETRWGTAFRAHADRVVALESYVDPQTNRPRSLLPEDWRSWFTPHFDRVLKRCQHVGRTMVEVTNAHGVWGTEICDDCGLQVAGPECPHVSCTWQANERALICDNCGHDGT